MYASQYYTTALLGLLACVLEFGLVKNINDSAFI
jgi:hypothetical protein